MGVSKDDGVDGRAEVCRALVTGSSGGIGSAIVEEFAKRGYSVIAHARSRKPEFEDFLNRVALKHHVEIDPVYFDLCDTDGMKKAVRNLFKEGKYPSILVNNAGVAHGGLFEMTSVAQIKKVFEVNLFSSMALTQLVLRGMAKIGQGSIVNVASISGLDLLPGNSAYGVSKAAMIAWTKTLAGELGGRGIRVNAVAPGLTDTRMSLLVEDRAGKEMLESSAMNRKATTREIASAVCYLASDDASFVNGQTLRVDGGGVVWVRGQM